jgi:APA family basic amino acid/polyamine antiporter
MVVGNMVGAGVFLLPAAMAAYGGISLVGWLFSAIGALFIARTFSETSKLLPHANGGLYNYTRAGFGDFMGFLVAWGYWISTVCANAAIVVSLVSALSTFFPILASSAPAAVLTGLSAIWLLTWVNTRGIRSTGEVQLVTTILKLVPLAAIAFIGFFYIDWHHFTPFNRSQKTTLQAIGATAAMTLFAFVGVESATVTGDNIENPERTIPRATMLGAGVTTLIYVFGTMSVMGLLSANELGKSVTPFADAAGRIWGPRSGYWVSAGVAMAAFGALNGWILVQGQMPSAVASDRLLPAAFARHNKRGAPYVGIILSSLFISLIMVMNYTKGLVEQFRFLMLLSTLTCLVPYLFVSAAYVMIVIDRQKPGDKVGWTKVITTAALAFIFSVLAIIGAGEEIVFWGFVLLLLGTPFYVYNSWKRKRS